MVVSYKKLLHLMIEKDITNARLMKDANHFYEYSQEN